MKTVNNSYFKRNSYSEYSPSIPTGYQHSRRGKLHDQRGGSEPTFPLNQFIYKIKEE